MFEPLLAHMGTDRLALAPDTPGYGLSDPPPAPLSIPDYAAALGDAVDALDLGEIDLMGAHTGSRIAVEFAFPASPHNQYFFQTLAECRTLTVPCNKVRLIHTVIDA